MAGNFLYRVTAPCFFDGTYRTADHHAKVASATKLDPCPSYLEPVEHKEPAGSAGDVDATDAAVELAEEHGIDLATVEGTGKGGRIGKGDVQKVVDAEVI